MPFLRRKQAAGASPEHAVITYLPLAGGEFGTDSEREAVFELEERIERAVGTIGGEHDGNEFGDGEVVLYAYGSDADALFEAIRGSLGDFPLRPGARAVKRYGPPGDSPTETVELV